MGIRLLQLAGIVRVIQKFLQLQVRMGRENILDYTQNVSTGSLCYSGPCDLCQRILKERGIKQAIFPTQEGYKIMELTKGGY